MLTLQRVWYCVSDWMLYILLVFLIFFLNMIYLYDAVIFNPACAEYEFY